MYEYRLKIRGGEITRHQLRGNRAAPPKPCPRTEAGDSVSGQWSGINEHEIMNKHGHATKASTTIHEYGVRNVGESSNAHAGDKVVLCLRGGSRRRNPPEQGSVETKIVTVLLLVAVVFIAVANNLHQIILPRASPYPRLYLSRMQILTPHRTEIRIRVLIHHHSTSRIQDNLHCSRLGRNRTPPSDLPQDPLPRWTPICHLRVWDHRNQVATRIARPMWIGRIGSMCSPSTLHEIASYRTMNGTSGRSSKSRRLMGSLVLCSCPELKDAKMGDRSAWAPSVRMPSDSGF